MNVKFQDTLGARCLFRVLVPKTLLSFIKYSSKILNLCLFEDGCLLGFSAV
jgi:hypothetical protein